MAANNEIKVRNKGIVHTTDEWTNTSNSNYKGNITINKGELAFTEKDGIATDMKIGDGSSTWGNLPYYLIHPNIKPIIEKTYTGVTCSANSDPAAWLFFGNVLPDSYTEQWEITYRIYATIAGSVESNLSYVRFTGMRNAIVSYTIFNSITNGSYRAYHNHLVYRAKEAGVTNGYGHALGLRFQSSWNPNVADNARTIKVEIMDMKRCSFTIYNSMLLYANVPGTGTTNYDGRSEYDGTSNGFKSNGDNNDITTVQMANMHLTAGTNGLKQYSLCMMDKNGTYQSFTTNNGTGTKTKNTVEFLLGHMFYLNMSGNIASGAVTGSNVVRSYQSWIDFRYSSNCGTGLTANKMVYIVGTLKNGLFTLAEQWWTQTLPTSVDGKVYIPVGMAYSTYQIDFMGYKGAYFHNGTTLAALELPPLTEAFSGSTTKALISNEDGTQLKWRGISDTTFGISANSSFVTANSLYNSFKHSAFSVSESSKTNWKSLPYLDTSEAQVKLYYRDSYKIYFDSSAVYLNLGDSSHKGIVRLYNNGKYGDLNPVSLSDNRSWTLPNIGGTLSILESWTNSVDSNTSGNYLASTIKINGTNYYIYGKDTHNNAVSKTETNPTSGTWYQVPFMNTTSPAGLLYNDGFKIHTLQGTASAAGNVYLQLGNATSSGTAGNKRGFLRIYSEKSGYTDLRFISTSTTNRYADLPDASGTLSIFTTSPTSGQVVVTDGTGGVIKSSGYTIATSVPSGAVFTDTKVTAVGNHYTPTSDSNSQISVDASSTTAATWNSTSLVTGINIQRDAKGHVTGVTVDSIKMPANPNTNTDTLVTQTNSTGNAEYRLLLDPNADNTTRTTTSLKSTNFRANPSTGMLYSNIFDAATAFTPAAGKVAGLTAGHSRLYGNGLVISNPATPNDLAWLRVTGTGENDTVLEIATGDDAGAGEEIVVRQYNTSNTIGRQLTLLNKDGNTKIPGNLTGLTSLIKFTYTGTVPISKTNTTTVPVETKFEVSRFGIYLGIKKDNSGLNNNYLRMSHSHTYLQGGKVVSINANHTVYIGCDSDGGEAKSINSTNRTYIRSANSYIDLKESSMEIGSDNGIRLNAHDISIRANDGKMMLYSYNHLNIQSPHDISINSNSKINLLGSTYIDAFDKFEVSTAHYYVRSNSTYFAVGDKFKIGGDTASNYSSEGTKLGISQHYTSLHNDKIYITGKSGSQISLSKNNLSLSGGRSHLRLTSDISISINKFRLYNTIMGHNVTNKKKMKFYIDTNIASMAFGEKVLNRMYNGTNFSTTIATGQSSVAFGDNVIVSGTHSMGVGKGNNPSLLTYTPTNKAYNISTRKWTLTLTAAQVTAITNLYGQSSVFMVLVYANGKTTEELIKPCKAKYASSTTIELIGIGSNSNTYSIINNTAVANLRVTVVNPTFLIRGNYSFATGESLLAYGDNQLVIGKWNASDTTSLFIIGQGTASARKSLLTVNGSTGNLLHKATMIIESANGNYAEGIRINKGNSNYSTLLLGANAGTVSGTQDGAWWIGVNHSSYSRRLMFGHNGSGTTNAYFYAEDSGTTNISLHIKSIVATGILDVTATSVSWNKGRDVARLRQKVYNNYCPILSVKTTDGSWELGPYTNNILHFTYITDTDYSGSNNQTVDIQIKPDGTMWSKNNQFAFVGNNNHTHTTANSLGALTLQIAGTTKTTYSGAAATFNVIAADASNAGVVNTTTQTFAGLKTFSGNIIVNNELTIGGSYATTDSNAYNSTNPRITFKNNGSSQNGQLIFTDYDSVQSPASLTFIGNQGGEFFIAPNIKATSNLYGAGSNITALNGSNISSGTVALARGGTGATTAEAALTNLGLGLTTISKNITFTAADTWYDTGISGTNIPSNGTYIVQVSGIPSTGTNMYSEIWSGVMSWRSEGTNSTDTDEIILHKAGHASNLHNIYLRTVRQSSSVMKLQIAANFSYTTAVNVTFKFRKMI